MHRYLRLCMRLVLVAVLLLHRTAVADQTDPRLGELFVRLRTAGSPSYAAAIETEILRIWSEITDADAQALYARGTVAIAAGDVRTASAAFDLLIQLQPRFAEAWNKRATLRYMVGNYDGSIADIEQTLALEPRHFAALSGLALILARQGHPGEAARSLKAALAINPFLPRGQERLQRLEREAAGEPT